MIKQLAMALSLGLSATALAKTGAPGDVLGCEHMLDGSVVPFEQGRFFVMVRPPGMEAVSSTVTYTLDYTLKNLGYAQKDLAKVFKDQEVVLVGEGFGELLPTLNNAGAKVIAVDPLYALSNLSNLNLSALPESQQTQLVNVDQFLLKYRPQLISGTAQSLPLPTASVSWYITHLVYSNFIMEDGDSANYPAIFAAIDESLRVLKPGGTAINVIELEFPDYENNVEHHLVQLQRQGKINDFTLKVLGTARPDYRSENGSAINHLPEHEFKIGRLVIHKF